MAAIDERNGRYRVMFRHHGKPRNFTLGRVTEAEAKAKADQVDYLLMRLDQGLIALPPGADIVTFLRHDGSVPTTGGEAKQDRPTLVTLRTAIWKPMATARWRPQKCSGASTGTSST